MATHLLLLSKYQVKSGQADNLAKALTKEDGSRILADLNKEEVIELRTINNNTTTDELASKLIPEAQNLSKYIIGDINRELLSLVEAPKNVSTLLPETPYIQLRHVEVKPDAMENYRRWREETIFDVVNNAEDIEVFLAYHSVISGQPGVMFVSGFSANPEKYNKIFSSERYRSIVTQAGDNYITGGTNGLYTKTYQEPPCFSK